MLKVGHIASYDRLVDIKEYVTDDSGLERLGSLTTKYSNIPAAEIRSGGKETLEGYQIVGLTNRVFLVRKMDRDIDATMLLYENDEEYQITSVHSFGGDRSRIIIECESKDNA